MPRFLLISLLILMQQAASASIAERAEVRQFIEEMVTEHNFDADSLTDIFSRTEIAESIIKAISRPAEAKPWYQYRPIFLTSDRIRQGMEFLRENRQTLRRAEELYGVPVEIIVAIIGVETRYGRNAGSYRVIDSLSTLAFDYPRRSAFFRAELKQFLLLAREQKLDPLSVTGSYAGAMGIPQFISSSYRHYAIDFDDDGHIDIWQNPVDAIGSVANYFKMHGWQAGEAIACPASVENDDYLAVLGSDLEPSLDTSDLDKYGIVPKQVPVKPGKVKFLEYELQDGFEYWLGFHNFYVITRYNHSPLYAMAVYQLAGEIRTAYEATHGR